MSKDWGNDKIQKQMGQFNNNHIAYLKIKQKGKQFEIKVSKIEISRVQNRTFNNHKTVLKQSKTGNKCNQETNKNRQEIDK